MSLNLQTIESELLEHFAQAEYGEAFLRFVEDQLKSSPVAVLGDKLWRKLQPAAAERLMQMEGVFYDGNPDFQADLVMASTKPKVIFANIRLGGVEHSEEYAWLQNQSILPKTDYLTPMQDWFGAAMRDQGESWLGEACNQEYQKKISYIVLSGFDNAVSLEEMLKSFSELTEPRDDNELIIVLNGYTTFPQQAIDYAVKRGFSVKTVFRNKNIGIGLGFNEGLRIANGQYICYLQDDLTFHQQNWDRELASYLDDHDFIGIIGGYCPLYTFAIPRKSSHDFPYTHIRSTIKGRCDWPLLNQAVAEADLTVCICMMVRRELAEYDWRYAPTGIEDLALCMEARLKGYKIFVTDVGIEHAMTQSVIRGDRDVETRKSEIQLGMPILRGFHYPYFTKKYGHLLRPAESKGDISCVDDMISQIKILPKNG